MLGQEIRPSASLGIPLVRLLALSLLLGGLAPRPTDNSLRSIRAVIGETSFVCERRERDLPASTLLADHVCRRHPRLVEKHFVERRTAVHLPERTHLDS